MIDDASLVGSPTSMQRATMHVKINGHGDHSDHGEHAEQHTQVYAKRWLILLIFVVLSASNSFQWIEYSIIQDVVMDFYGTASHTFSKSWQM